MITMQTASITSGQKKQIVRVITDSVEKAIDELVKAGALNKSGLQRVLAQGKSLSATLVSTAKGKITELAEQVIGYLKCIGQEVILEPTDGTELISSAVNTFRGYIDSCFNSWNLNVPSVPTKKTKVQVYEMVKDGTFAQLFGSSGENLDRLCLTQSQIKQFCSNHSDWLRSDGYGTFFLFKVNGQFFVAGVYRYSDGLYVRVDRLSYVDVWGADDGHRVVVPQL